MLNKKLIYLVLANLIFVGHFLLVLIALFGWSIPEIWSVYMLILVLTLLSDMVLGYCILSKWEFDLRKKINPETDYNFMWSTFYTYKLTNNRIPDKYFKRFAITGLVAMIGINLYIKFW